VIGVRGRSGVELGAHARGRVGVHVAVLLEIADKRVLAGQSDLILAVVAAARVSSFALPR
jgi:hypothetical protein